MRRAARLSSAELAPFLIPQEEKRPLQETPGLASYPSIPLDWQQVFRNGNPVEIEVGFGKGLFLLTSAHDRPDTNFLGIEIERKYALFTATRLAKRGLTNVKVASSDARWFLEKLVPAQSVSALHVYFPDPWWKNRHRKRRLFTPAFASQCERVLRPGGKIHLVSDVEEYFAECVQILSRLDSLERLPAPELKNPKHDMDFLTNFERKYRREGRPIYRGVWVKTALLHDQRS